MQWWVRVQQQWEYFNINSKMKSNENSKLLRYILKYQPKTNRQLQASQNFTTYIQKRKQKIELLQYYSVSNQIYIFPRNKVMSSSSSSISQSMQNRNDESLQYNLGMQNKRNKSYQYSSQLHFKNNLLQKQTEQRPLSKMKTKSQLNQSLDRKQLVLSIKKAKLAKEQSPLKNNSRKKKKQEQKTLLNSSKRLIVAEQYSLGTHPNQANTKKGSENATLNCRSKPIKIKLKTEV